MSKNDFLARLRKGLTGLSQEDVEERLLFYSEMIDDRMEEGLSEEEAVLAVGSVDEIASQIIGDIPLSKIAAEKAATKRHLKAWEIVFLALGSPIWLSLLIAALAVVFSLVVSLWSVIVSLWAVFVSVAACALCFIAVGIGFTLGVHRLSGITMIGAGIVCAGLSIFLFFGCKAATKGSSLLTKNTVLWIKNCFTKKEEA